MSCTHDCGCSAETRDARTDDWGHTSPLSPQNADLREFQPAEPSQPLGFIKERLADPYRCSGGPQDRVFLDYLLALVESLTAERDALRARLAAVEALADAADDTDGEHSHRPYDGVDWDCGALWWRR